MTPRGSPKIPYHQRKGDNRWKANRTVQKLHYQLRENTFQLATSRPEMDPQLGEQIRGLSFEDRPRVSSFTMGFRKIWSFAERHLSKIKALVCGTMLGSSAALPFLYPLRLKGLCLVYSAIPFLSDHG
jgi:hypothetical protein